MEKYVGIAAATCGASFLVYSFIRARRKTREEDETVTLVKLASGPRVFVYLSVKSGEECLTVPKVVNEVLTDWLDCPTVVCPEDLDGGKFEWDDTVLRLKHLKELRRIT